MTRESPLGPDATPSRRWQFRAGSGGSALLIHVHPGSPATRIKAIQNDAVIEIDLRGDDNPWHTNQELVTYLSRVLQIPEANIEIVAGMYRRGKVVVLEGLSAREATERLRRALAAQPE
ncbi:MAG: DUF167 domain-containing protein [Chloroflexi bacterium]|nr:DUF167 domain-containing protein [Chloroflexota bacterium]